MLPQNNLWKLSVHSGDSLSFVPHFVRAQDEVPVHFYALPAGQYEIICQRDSSDSINGKMFNTSVMLEPPIKINQSNNHEPWMLFVIIGLTILTSIAISFSFRRLAALIKATYSVRHYLIFRKNYSIFSDPATFVLVPVHASCISFISLLLLKFYDFPLTVSNLIFFTSLTIGLLLLRLMKVIIASMLAVVFDTRVQTKAYFENSYIYDSATVFFLLPLCWMLLFSPISDQLLVLGTIILVIINGYRFIMSIYNGIQNTAYSIFYFILYLCTVELMPLLLLVKLLKENNI